MAVSGLISLLKWLVGQFVLLYHMFLSPISGTTHKDRLESFYSHQASGYDEFRRKLLHGREDMLAALFKGPKRVQKDAIWVDFGGGTGSNVEFMHQQGRLSEFKKVYIVDLSSSLLTVARERIATNGWKNVEAVEADATTWRPQEQVDLVTFSYSLTMIPDWFLAMEHGLKILRTGGLIGIVDFYISRKYPAEGLRSMNWLYRTFWQLWFAFDNVNLSPDHVPFLMSHFKKRLLEERRGPAPILSLLTLPHYIFVGEKSE